MLSHINKRLKAGPSVQLPLEELVQSLWLGADQIPALSGGTTTSTTTTTATPLIKNFALIYLEMGFPRATKEVPLFVCMLGGSLLIPMGRFGTR